MSVKQKKPTSLSFWRFPWGVFRGEFSENQCVEVIPWEIPEIGYQHEEWKPNASSSEDRAFSSLEEFFQFWKTVRRYPTGTPFQNKVWDRLTKVPFGETLTYGEIAKEIGHPGAFRAVGTAVGANPWTLAVPCHRVLPANKKVAGFAWGTPMKALFLRKEGAFFL